MENINKENQDFKDFKDFKEFKEFKEFKILITNKKRRETYSYN